MTRYIQPLLGIAAGVLLLTFAACGGGAGAAAGGNTVSGQVTATGLTAAARTALSAAFTAYDDLTVQLLGADGAVVDTATVGDNGSFTFMNVNEGDYTIAVVDGTTGDTVAEVGFSCLNGDDVFISGTISEDTASWSVDFTANTMLQNEEQTEKALAIAQVAGLDVADVLAMREDGLGWGVIALQLGVHPSELGLGNNDGFEKAKTTAAKGKPDGAGGKPDGAGKPDDKGKPDNPGKGNN